MQPFAAGAAGAIVGLVACLALFWAAPAGLRRKTMWFLLVPLTFGISSGIFFSGTTLGVDFLEDDFGLAVFLTLPASAVMAGSLGHTGQSFNGLASRSRLRVAIMTASAAGCGAAIMFFGAVFFLAVGLAGVLLLPLFPAFWLGLVTYFCLKPLSQKPIDGL